MSDCTATLHGTINAYNKYRCRCPEATALKVRSNAQVVLRRLAGTPGIVDATGTRRRVEALHAIGWRAVDLASRLGCTAPAVRQIKWRKTVQRTTALQVAALYDELADHRGPSTRLITTARGWGWLPPLWWDEDTIDDPSYVPPTVDQVHWSDVDPVAVERACKGDDVPLTRAERIHAVVELHQHGANDCEIGRRLGLDPAQVWRDRSKYADRVAS